MIIRVLPKNKMRYKTSGDYYRTKKGELVFDIVKQKNEFMLKMQLLHELIEQILCQENRISNEDIDKFDMNYKDKGYDEPGDDPESIYHRQHVFAKNIERLICNELGIDFKTYFDAIK